MDKFTLITLLESALTLLRAGNDLGVDVTSSALEGLKKGLVFPGPKPEYFYVSFVGHNLPVPNELEINTGKNLGKLRAVKEYKNRTGQSLMASKYAIEEYFEGNGWSFFHL